MGYDFPEEMFYLNYGSLTNPSTGTVAPGGLPASPKRPFDTPIGPPRDENGALLPAYATQAFRIEIHGTDGPYLVPGAYTSPPQNYDLKINLEATFETEDGQPLGALVCEWNYRAKIQFTTVTNDFSVLSVTTSRSTVDYSQRLGMPITNTNIERNRNFSTREERSGLIQLSRVDSYAKERYSEPPRSPSVGAYSTVFDFSTPTFQVNLPHGFKVTSSLSVTSGATTYPLYAYLYLAKTPNSLAMMTSDGQVSASAAAPPNLSNQLQGRWTALDSIYSAAVPAFNAAAWDAYYPSGDGWKRAAAPGGGKSATFALEFDEEGENTAYVRLTDANGWIGWTSVTAQTTGAGKDTIGAVQMPDGSTIMAAKGTGGVVITRIEKDAATGKTLATIAGQSRPSLTLKKSGELALLTRDNASKNLVRRVSGNGGESWQ